MGIIFVNVVIYIISIVWPFNGGELRLRKLLSDLEAEWGKVYYGTELPIAAERPRSADYVMFRHSPFHGKYINSDEMGRRETWNANKAGAKTIIYFYGGSTAWGWGNRDDATIPSALSHLLDKAGFSVT